MINDFFKGLLESFGSSDRDRSLMTLARNEYKNDWEWAYNWMKKHPGKYPSYDYKKIYRGWL